MSYRQRIPEFVPKTLSKIALGGTYKLHGYIVSINDLTFHYQQNKKHADGLYGFNINSATFKSKDYTIWICGSEFTYYVIPMSVIEIIYNHPNSNRNTYPQQEDICTIRINSNSDQLSFGSFKKTDISEYKNLVLSNLPPNIQTQEPTVPPDPSPDLLEVTLRKYGVGGESLDHRQLKEWLAHNPAFLGLPNDCFVEIDDHVFPSGDRPDLIFSFLDNQYLIVEVELENCLPGFYQAIKYKPLLCVEKDLPIESDNVRSALVANKIPNYILNLSTKYNVSTYVKNIV